MNYNYYDYYDCHDDNEWDIDNYSFEVPVLCIN